MHVKSLRRIALMIVALVASSLSLVAVSSAPASAAGYTAFAELESNYTSVKHGVAVKFTGRVLTTVDGNDYYVPAGKASLQRLNYGSSTWVTISTKTLTIDTDELTWTYTPSATASYRIRYSGGSYDADTFTADDSPSRKVSVKRNLRDNFKQSTRVFYGKVTPSYGGRTLYIQKSTCGSPTSSSCTWSLYKTVKTTSTGAWSTKLPVYSRRTHFRGLVKASNGYLGNYSNFYVTTYRY